MRKKDLRQFNPASIAHFDLEMWKAYYNHKFLKLFSLLVALIHKQFALSYPKSILVAYHVAVAAADFRLKKGHESIARPLKHLTAFYKTVSKNSFQFFDYKKAAKLELDWWFIDRYPERYTITREEGLCNAVAVLYDINPSKLQDYAKYRAQAMVLHDKAENANIKTDWEKVGELLKQSFQSLHEAVR